MTSERRKPLVGYFFASTFLLFLFAHSQASYASDKPACHAQEIASLDILADFLPRLVVPIRLDGRDARFFIDTGAARSGMAYSMSDGMSIYTSKRGEAGAGGGGTSKYVRVSQFTLGAARFDNFDLMLWPDSSVMSKSRNANGNIGSDLLEGMDIEIDPGKRKIAFYPYNQCGEQPIASSGALAVVPFDVKRDGKMVISVTLNGKRLRALIDTGSPSSVMTTDSAKDVFGLRPSSGEMTPLGTVNTLDGAHVQTYRTQFQSMDFEGVLLDKPWIVVGDFKEAPGVDLVLGMNHLQMLHLYFDSRHEKLYAALIGEEIEARRRMPDKAAAAVLEKSDFLTREGVSLGKLQLYDEAVVKFDEALSLNPRNPVAYAQRGILNGMRDRYDAAVTDLTASLHLQASDSTSFLRGLAYQEQGQYALAVQDFSDAMRANPDDISLLNARCWAGALAEQFAIALADCDRALQMAPDSPELLDSRGLVHLKMKRLDKAYADYDAAVSLNPADAASLYGRGLARLWQGRTLAAEEDFVRAKRLDPAIEKTFAGYGLSPAIQEGAQPTAQ